MSENPVSGPSSAPQSDRVRDVVAVATGALMLLGVALFNGYPLLYWDSASHIVAPIDHVISWARSPAYGVAILPIHLCLTLWPVIAFQAGVMAWLLHRTAFMVLGHVGSSIYLLIVAITASCTSLPWTVGQIMPDVFAGAALLGLSLLAFGSSRGIERVVLIGLTSFAIAAHQSHLALAVALAGVLAVGSLFSARGVRRPPRLGAVLAAPLFGALLIVAANAFCDNRFDVTPPWKASEGKEHEWHSVTFKGPVLAPYGGILPLVGLLTDGPARDYLIRDCRNRSYLLCPHLDAVSTSREQLSWDAKSAIYRAGGIEALRMESRTIVLRTLVTYPLRCIHWALVATVRQLGCNDVGDGLLPFDETDEGGGRWPAIVIRDHFPHDRVAFLGARQNAGSLPFSGLRRVGQGTLVAGTVLSVIVLVLAWRRRAEQLFGLGVFFAIALVLHAAVVSVGSGVAARFGARVAWIVPFYSLVGIVWLLRRVTPRS